MKLSNFEMLASFVGARLAEVDVTTGMLWWRKTTRRQIGTKAHYWIFLDTGEFTPGFQAEELASAYELRRLINRCGIDGG